MGLLSSSVSISRYRVEGKIEKPVTEAVAKGLRKYAIADIDEDTSEKSVGWTSFENPFSPNFETSSFLFGNLFIFSLRVDRKSIPAKLLKKYVTLETFKRLDKSKRRFLSKDEKKAIKDKVITDLAIRIPSTPNVYDLIWDYEKSNIYFFSSLRALNSYLYAILNVPLTFH